MRRVLAVVSLLAAVGAPRFAAAQRPDELLAAEANELERAGQADQARGVREALLSRFPESALGPDALVLVGASFHAQAIYDRAAEAYERYVERYPVVAAGPCTDRQRASGMCLSAIEALGNAAYFRYALGQPDRATADVRMFERLYGATRRADAAEMALGIGSQLSRAGAYAAAARAHAEWLAHYGRVIDADLRLEAQAALGEALWKTRDRRGALRAFREAEREWNAVGDPAWEPARATLVIPCGGRGDDAVEATNARRFAARSALARARFYLAEEARESLMARSVPPYRGGTSARGLAAWVDEDLRRFREGVDAARRAATSMYEHVAELHVTEWEVASAARVAEMSHWLHAILTEPVVPAALRASPALSAQYLAALDAGSDEARQAEAFALEQCLAVSIPARSFDDWHRRCEAAREALDPVGFAPVAELHAAPDFRPLRPAPSRAFP